MTAAYDDRLDALVPEGAWNSLVQATGPNAALRSDYLAASVTATGSTSSATRVMVARTQLASVAGTFAFDLGGVATTLQPDDQLYPRLDGANEQYATEGGIVPERLPQPVPGARPIRWRPRWTGRDVGDGPSLHAPPAPGAGPRR